MHLPCVPLAQAAYDGHHVRPKQIEQKLILTALPVAIEPEEFLSLGDHLVGEEGLLQFRKTKTQICHQGS